METQNLERKALKANYKNNQLNSEIERLDSTETPLYLIKEEGTLQDRLRLYKAEKIADYLISTPYGVGESAFYVFKDLQEKNIEVPHKDLVRELGVFNLSGMSGLGSLIFERLCGYSSWDKEEGKSIAPLIKPKGKERLIGFIYDHMLKNEINESPIRFAEKHSLNIKQPEHYWTDLDRDIYRDVFREQVYEKAPLLRRLKERHLKKLNSEVKK